MINIQQHPAPLVVALRHHNYFDKDGNKVNNQQPIPQITLPAKNGRLIAFTVDHFEFACIYPNCDKIFELTNDLYDHIRDHHTQDQRKCPKQGCNKQFKCMATLVYHARRHTTIKPYICPMPNCTFDTAAKGNLKSHLLSNQHKDIMSLALLNTILSMDTVHARPETYLHAPREKRIYRLGMANKNPESKLRATPTKRKSDDSQILIHNLGDFPQMPAKRRRKSKSNRCDNGKTETETDTETENSDTATQQDLFQNNFNLPPSLTMNFSSLMQPPPLAPFSQQAFMYNNNATMNMNMNMYPPMHGIPAISPQSFSLIGNQQPISPFPNFIQMPPLESQTSMQQIQPMPNFIVSSINQNPNISNNIQQDDVQLQPKKESPNECDMVDNENSPRKSAADMIFEAHGMKPE